MAILLAISHVVPFFDVQYIGDYASIEQAGHLCYYGPKSHPYDCFAI